ncbi:unnamed protein product [Caenorhabditis sp. 36 PRJEB53466]|nr:unnamed protein product [Caenorhabditis sp. 36 PRJEB53466]
MVGNKCQRWENGQKGAEIVRDSQLTDYDISDFNAHEEPHYHTVLTNQQLQQQRPSAIQEERRRTTADSDDYVKVSEPIYDYPPKTEQKRISPTEAAQLQELYQEYDLGLDIPGVAPIATKPPQQQQRPIQIQQQQVITNQPNVMIRQDSVPQSPRTVINVPISRKTEVPIQGQPQQQGSQPAFSYNVPVQVKDDPRNLATADLFVQDALEYIGHQDKSNNAGAFVMEEEMLSSHEPAPDSGKKRAPAKHPSIEATSRQVRTNDVFERVEHDEHDDMTYAPEIQSVEIPPDQMSETSENMIDYFDKVAAESEQQIQNLQQQQQNTLKKQQIEPIPDSSLLKPVGRAPQILPAFGNRAPSNSSLGSAGRSGSAVSSSDIYPYRHLRKQSSLLSVLGVTSMQEMLLTITSLDSLSEAMRRRGEESFGGRSLHTIHPHVKNPYQQVITILGRTLAPFAGDGNIGVYGFGDAKTGDWSTFNLKTAGDCRSLDEVLHVYNTVTPTVALSGPTNFAPLIYQAMEICQKSRDYHILVIIADGQVTNERATRRAIVQACQHPLSIIVVGVGDGPWDMMRIFDESLPKRPWDNFHFVEYHDIIKKSTCLEDGDVKVAVQSLLEIPDQYRCICELGLLDRSIPPRGSEIRREMMHNPLEMALDKGTWNVVQLSVSFMLQFFSYMSQEFIQEPLIEAESQRTGKIDPHAGYHSFAILYFFFTISCLLVTPIVEKITAKWSMVLGLVAYIAFQAGFLQLNEVYLYVTSAGLGIGGAFLWIAQGKYLTENCTGKTIERNTSLMWVIFKISLLGGGIFLYFMFQNQTLTEFVENGGFRILCYIFCSISILATINTILLPQPAYKPEKQEKETLAQTLKSTFKIMREKPMMLLAVIFIYAGFSRSFWIAIYPTCIKFTSKLGENTTKLLAVSCIATGIGQIGAGAIFSVIGKKVRIVGRDSIVAMACAIHLLVFVAIYLFFPADAPLHTTDNVGYFPPNVYVAIICSGLLGFGDAVIQTQIYAFLCDGYSQDSSHAFALFKFYSAMSSTVAFYISKYFTLSGHLSLYGVFAILSAVTSILAQRMYLHKTQHFFQDNVKQPVSGTEPIKIEISDSGSTITSRSVIPENKIMALFTSQTRNVLRVSISMMVLFSAILSHEFITEPLIVGISKAGLGGIQEHDGYLSLCIIYFFNTITCPFAPYAVTRITGKWAMVVGMFCMVCYQWAFFKMSLVYGGVFFLIFFQNSSISDIVTSGQMSYFIFVFLACSVISIINTVFLPQPEMALNRKPQPFFKTTNDSFSLMKTPRMICLALFFFYTGFVRSFWISIYPTCIKFTSQLSPNTTNLLALGMVVTGCGQVFGSIFVTLIGLTTRKFRQHVFVLSALTLHIVLFILISLSFPNESSLRQNDQFGPVFHQNVLGAMAISALLGFGDAILQTQIYSYIAQYYKKESSCAFAVFRFSSGIASTIMFFSAQYFYLLHHIILLICSAFMAGIAVLAIYRLRKTKVQDSSAFVVSVFTSHSPLTSSR